jgi:hypothetical protein
MQCVALSQAPSAVKRWPVPEIERRSVLQAVTVESRFSLSLEAWSVKSYTKIISTVSAFQLMVLSLCVDWRNFQNFGQNCGLRWRVKRNRL